LKAGPAAIPPWPVTARGSSFFHKVDCRSSAGRASSPSKKRVSFPGVRIATTSQEDAVQGTWSLIIVSNESPTVFKVRISRTTVKYLGIAALVSFLATMMLGYFLPEFDDVDHARLQTENRSLQIENKNLEVRAQSLETKVAGLEEMSERIQNLIEGGD
jgi:hypothetical protein